MADKISALANLISQCRHGVIFTGAGLSTESGIPDFRSPGGLWDRFKPIIFDEFLLSEDARRETWRRKLETDKVLSNAEPNQGHYAVKEFIQNYNFKSVITQNIDNLHQQSGVDEDCVIELHGNRTYAKCLDCQKRMSLQKIFDDFKKAETLPICDECSGIVKTATISFGQAMPLEEMQKAERETLQCDLFIVLGSSLSVYPAAGFPELATRKKAKLVIINRDETPLDSLASIVINDEIGNTLDATLIHLTQGA